VRETGVSRNRSIKASLVTDDDDGDVGGYLPGLDAASLSNRFPKLQVNDAESFLSS
jgi:hypothetical protein